MSSITDRINDLHRVNQQGRLLVDLDAVLEIVKNTVPVEIDPTMYETPEDQEERDTLAVLCTAYNLLADTAARFAGNRIRDLLKDSGLEVDTYEEAFAADSTPPNSWRDLAVHNGYRLMEIAAVFEQLVQESDEAAAFGLEASLRERL